MNRAAFVPLVALALTACNPAANLESGNASIKTFHEQLNAGQLAAIYSASSSEFKKAGSQAEMEKFLSAVRRKLGRYKTGKNVGWNVNSTTGGTYTTINHQAQYERGAAQEQFVLKSANGKTQLVAYNIDSAALVIN